MPPTDPSPLYRLATYRLGEDAGAWVRRRRKEGQSWWRLSLEIRDLTDRDVEVTPQTLITWSAANGDEEAA